jgi:hypothetical protein
MIPAAAFKPVTDPGVLRRLDAKARGRVLQADLRKLGERQFGQPWPPAFRSYNGWPELFFDGRPMTLARWPNRAWAQIKKVLEKGSVPCSREKPDRVGKFVYSGDRPRRWLEAGEVYLHGHWAYKWHDQSVRVGRIDPEQRTIELAAPSFYGIGGTSGGYYYAYNLLEELDEPGEYYLDRRTGQLYFWPPAPLAGKDIVVALLQAPFISMTGVSQVTVRELTFECSCGMGPADTAPGDYVLAGGAPANMTPAFCLVTGGANNLLAGCTVRNVASDAVCVRGGANHGVVSCDFYNLGGGGIFLFGGDLARLQPCGHFAENNHIHHYGRLFRTGKEAISLGVWENRVVVGCRVRHNLVHHGPHQAIVFRGNENLVELNEIHHVCLDTDDAGAINDGRNWTERGNVIRHNFIHDNGGGTRIGTQGIYLDDGTCGTICIGNVICRVCRGFLVGGGRDNILQNNILIECTYPIWADNRYAAQTKASPSYKHFVELLNRVPYRREPWRSRYPALAKILADQPFLPKGNVVEGNLIVRSGRIFLEPLFPRYSRLRHNWATRRDPGFVDAAHNNFQLRNNSIAFRKLPGFAKIPFAEIGLYPDEYRKTLPKRG